MAKKFFSKNAAHCEIFFNIDQYFLVFWEKVARVSILGKSVQYNGQYTDFFYRPQLSSLIVHNGSTPREKFLESMSNISHLLIRELIKGLSPD